MIELRLFGKPVAWAASRVGKKGHFNPRSEEKKAFMWQIKAAYKGPILSDCYFRLILHFFEPIPASTSSRIRDLMLAGEIIPTNQDCSNCNKFFEDCLKGIVIDDDRYVSYISGLKSYGEKAEIILIVIPWGNRALGKKAAAKHMKENLGGLNAQEKIKQTNRKSNASSGRSRSRGKEKKGASS